VAWLGELWSFAGRLAVAVAVAVAVAGGGSGKKMDEIGLLLTELRLFEGRLGIGWLWQWQWLGVAVCSRPDTHSKTSCTACTALTPST
jgi:hypothetical protein